MEESPEFQKLSMNIDSAKEESDRLLLEGKITEDQYNRNITVLAYEYVVNGYPFDGVIMLINADQSYFVGKILDHFREDEDFFTKCSVMFEILYYSKLVPRDIIKSNSWPKA